MTTGIADGAHLKGLAIGPNAKLLLDSDLNKIARWLRALGV
jgi:hypothetical protein